MGKGDRQRIRIIADKGADKRALCWLRRVDDDLYGGYGLGFHHSRHASGEFHLTKESGSPNREFPLAVMTTQWHRPNISQAVPGLRELFATVMAFNLTEEWENYPQFTPKKGYDRVVEIDCAAFDHLCLNVWLTDSHNVSSLRLAADMMTSNKDYARLCSETVETGRKWILLIEGYDMTRPLPPVDAGSLGMNLLEADKARLVGKIRFREYLAIRDRELRLRG